MMLVRMKTPPQTARPIRIKSSIGEFLFEVVEVEKEFAFEDLGGEGLESPGPPHHGNPSTTISMSGKERAGDPSPILRTDGGMLFARHAFKCPDLGILPADYNPPPYFPASRAVVRDAGQLSGGEKFPRG